MIDDTSDGDDILIECYHIHVTSRIIASSYVQCISMYQTLHIITILTTTTTIYIFMHIIPPNTIYNTILNIHIHIHINIHIQNSTRSSRRKRGPPRLTEIENVQVDETFSLSLPTTDDSQSLSQSLSQLKSQSQSQSKSQSRSRSRSQADSAAVAVATAAAAGEGCYISTTIHNKRYYGVLISQDSLKEASELHFMEEAKSLNLNRRMVDLRDVHGSVHDNGNGNGDGSVHDNGNDNNGGVGGTMANTVGESQKQKQKQKQRQVQKFKYVDATKKTTGYRVILATYANLEEAASGYGYGNGNGNGNRMLDEIKSACEKVS